MFFISYLSHIVLREVQLPWSPQRLPGEGTVDAFVLSRRLQTPSANHAVFEAAR